MVSTKVSNTRGSRAANRPASFRAVNQDIDAEFLYTDPLTQKSYPTWMVTAVDELMYKIRHKDIWQIVDFCLEIWAKKHPKEHKRFLKTMQDFRRNRKNQYATTESKSIRNLLELPPELTYLLYKLASHKIEDYGNSKFWRDFAKRYPAFRGGDKF